MMSKRPSLTNIENLNLLSRRILWLSHWMIHNANHLRPAEDGSVKVGGHQASSASMTQIMTALYFNVLRPEDRVAVKPHASPVFHAIQYLVDNLDVEQMKNFRGWKGVQSYPSRTKDTDDVDLSTGSVGLGAAITIFGSLVQDWLAARGDRLDVLGRFIALVGDAELDEGNVYEALQEGWKHDLRNCWWVIDYNRQSLDGVVREGLWQRIEAIFGAFGWRVVRLRHGAQQRAAFARPGGKQLQTWIEACPNQLYSALTYQGGAAWRKRLMDDIVDQGDVTALIDAYDDDALHDLMLNLGGHCIETLCEAFDDAAKDDVPTCFLAYTIKGWGTPLAGHKDNHAGLMNPTQMVDWQTKMGVPKGQEWEKWASLDSPDSLRDFAKSCPFFDVGSRRHTAPQIKGSDPVWLSDDVISTQAAFGKILDGLAKTGGDLADAILTTSPDVTVSTNLGAFINRRGLFGRTDQADTFRDQKVPSTQKWAFTQDGQHVELGIAEMNLFLLLGAAGLSHSLFGRRVIPIGTLYDPFVARGLDALNYACYMDARFIMVGTPSGVSLAPEGGAHQSIAQPLIGMSQDGLAAFEPAFADELSIIMDWSIAYIQQDGDDALDERTWLRDETGGAVYLRLSTRPMEQIGSARDDAFAQGVVDGGYWLRPPGPGTNTIIAYQGCVADQAIAAAGHLAASKRDVAVLAVTSADRLNAGWTAAQSARRRGNAAAKSHVERLLQQIPRDASITTVIDGHPATLAWLGGVVGHRTVSLGVEHFGQTGTVRNLYRHYGIDDRAIANAAEQV